MKRNNTVSSFVTQTRAIHKAMPSLGKVPKESKGMNLDSQANAITELEAQINDMNTARAKLVRRKAAKVKATRTFLTNLRLIVGGVYGRDSDEYEAVGGTRTSARKKAKRAPAAPKVQIQKNS